MLQRLRPEPMGKVRVDCTELQPLVEQLAALAEGVGPSSRSHSPSFTGGHADQPLKKLVPRLLSTANDGGNAESGTRSGGDGENSPVALTTPRSNASWNSHTTAESSAATATSYDAPAVCAENESGRGHGSGGGGSQVSAASHVSVQEQIVTTRSDVFEIFDKDGPQSSLVVYVSRKSSNV